VSARVARSRELVAAGRKPAVVARVAGVSRQAIYRKPKPRRPPQRRLPSGPVDEAIAEVAKANPTDGTRMVAALTSRRLGRPINRKRAQRVMREQRLLQRHRPLRRRRRPGFFRVERPDQLWHLDMTSVWVAEHGWTYLNAIIDCCTREIVGWSLELRCRTQEAITLVDRAVVSRGNEPDELTLGTDNGSAFTSRAFRARLGELGHHPPPRRLPRPREPGLHRVLVRKAEGATRLALGIRDAQPRERGDRRLHRQLPPPPSLRPPLSHASGSAADLGGWTATSEIGGLNCRRRRGPGQAARRVASVLDTL
jgi:putative transposase